MNKVVLIIGILVVLLAVVVYGRRGTTVEISQPMPTMSVSNQEIKTPDIQIIAQDLQIPWEVAFLPDGRLLLTERPGRVRLIDQNGRLKPEPVATIPDVKHIGEGGLLGMALHPDFSQNNFVYLYYTYSASGNQTLNKVVRYKFDGQTLTSPVLIVGEIPGAPNHNGGRIKFGPDRFLYITTGDAREPSLAQNTNSLAGKILRVTDEGQPAPGNPFDSAGGKPFNNRVWSYGHRNPQGLAWDKQGRLWETEHGSLAADELNLIEPGKNYGWPVIRGSQKRDGMVSPVLQSGDTTWAPSGMANLDGSLFFAGLRGQALFEALVKDGNAELKEHFKGEFGRIRDAVLGPDGFLYILTNNTDGRGTPRPGDDKLIKIQTYTLQVK